MLADSWAHVRGWKGGGASRTLMSLPEKSLILTSIAGTRDGDSQNSVTKESAIGLNKMKLRESSQEGAVLTWVHMESVLIYFHRHSKWHSYEDRLLSCTCVGKKKKRKKLSYRIHLYVRKCIDENYVIFYRGIRNPCLTTA